MKVEEANLERDIDLLTTAVYALQVQSDELLKSINESLDEYTDSLLQYCSERLFQITQDEKYLDNIHVENAPVLIGENCPAEEQSVVSVQVTNSSSLMNSGLREIKFIQPNVLEIIDEGSLFNYELPFHSFKLLSQFFSSLESREALKITPGDFSDKTMGKPSIHCSKLDPKPPDIANIDWTLNSYYWTSKNVQDTCSCTLADRIK